MIDTAITHYLCIGCPLGCRLEVHEDDQGDIVEVRGFSCRKGKIFAEREHTDPRRMVTTTVAVPNGRWARLPVHTSVEVSAPIRMGDVVVPDVLGTGADGGASRDLLPSVDG